MPPHVDYPAGRANGLPFGRVSTLMHRLCVQPPGWLTQLPVAHRGLHDPSRPENTLAAFEAAAVAGYAIELDVHASHDGEVVVFHDDTLERLTAHHGRIADRSGAALRAMKVGGSEQTIPSLTQVIGQVRDRVPIVVEIKNAGRAGALEAAVASVLRATPGRYSVQSFNPWSLLWFREHAPMFPRGLLATDFTGESMPRHEKILLRNLILAPLVRPTYVGYDLRCLPYWAPSTLRRWGLPLLAWTVRSEDDLRCARRLADNVIFENVHP